LFKRYVRACDEFASAYQCRMQVIKLADETATFALGEKLIKQLSIGQTVTLTGDLGAGKTTLVRGMIQSVLGDIDVPSPTYTLVQTYDMPDFELWHCDMYRLERPQDGYELGLMDAFEEAVCLIEWPDKRKVMLTGFKDIK